VESEPLFLAECLGALADRRDLTSRQMQGAMREIMAGRWNDAQMAQFLTGLRIKGETGQEIAAAAGVLRENMIPLDVGRNEVLDTCGTGGDGAGTFNISTAAALVAAGAGVRVVKHGNRAASGRTGSADVLAALGVQVDQEPAWAKSCLEQVGLAFCFAPRFHPAMHHVAGVRSQLGVRTIFNCLGPLANPARAGYQLLGVGRLEWLDPLAEALCRLGTHRAILVCGQDGLDEVSLTAPTMVREVRGGRTTSWEWTARDFELAPCRLEELRAEGIEDSAARILAILRGEESAAARMVLANASAALMAAGRATTLIDGVDLARQAITSGKARQVLERLQSQHLKSEILKAK
jgi:anthranilate phosphoribosyltransferase